MGRAEGRHQAGLGPLQAPERRRDPGPCPSEAEGAELIIKGADGSVQRRDSHGADDPAKKG